MKTTATATKTISLREFNNVQPITYLWFVGVGNPTGMEFVHDTTTEDQEEYCDFAELDFLERFWELEGTIDESNLWCWNGSGEVTDERANTIYNVKAR